MVVTSPTGSPSSRARTTRRIILPERVKVFVILKNGVEPSDELAKELKQHVRTVIGPLATPDELEFVPSLPKTRSGKIMRRVVRARELGEPVGDVTTMDT